MSRAAALVDNTIARITGLTPTTRLGGAAGFRHAEQTPTAEELQSAQAPDRRFVLIVTGEAEFSEDAPSGPLTEWTELDVHLELAVAYTVQRAFTSAGKAALEDQSAILYALTRADQYDADNTGIIVRRVRAHRWTYPQQVGGTLVATYTITVTYQPEVTA